MRNEGRLKKPPLSFSMNSIRNSAKAIIIRDGALLCTKNVGWRGDNFYLLPGGGQEHGETLIQALERECLEEIGARVQVNKLRYLRDYIGKNHAFAERHSAVHAVEFMFECELIGEPDISKVTNPDSGQTGLLWIELGKLHEYQIFPSDLKHLITSAGELIGAFYLGDSN
jgi:8-oxo-dGTP diphosphatase